MRAHVAPFWVDDVAGASPVDSSTEGQVAAVPLASTEPRPLPTVVKLKVTLDNDGIKLLTDELARAEDAGEKPKARKAPPRGRSP